MAAANACTCNCTNVANVLDGMDAWLPWHDVAAYFSYSPWVFSLLGSTMVGLTGIFPVWLIPIQDGVDLKTGENGSTLKILLSFAVGALLGDVFLHLLPEAFENDFQTRAEEGHLSAGSWILFAFLFFVIVEKIVATVNEEAPIVAEQLSNEISTKVTTKEADNNNCITAINATKTKNGFIKEYTKDTVKVQSFLEIQSGDNEYLQTPNGIKDLRKNGFKDVGAVRSILSNECPKNRLLMNGAKNYSKKLVKTNGFASTTSPGDPSRLLSRNNLVNRLVTKVIKLKSNVLQTKFFNPKSFPGYLNLLMNFLDNFTHGLSVGGSFLISFRVGALSTFAILVHEIPHEVGDFAILLRSGFNRWDAARAQLITAGGGIVGALTAVFFSGGLEERTTWILPLTAGGFIHIGLVTILPDLLKETNTKESLKQLGALLFGVIVMAALTFI